MDDTNGVSVEQLGGGAYIASGSFEDLMEFERQNQEAALAALQPDQRALLDGRAFCWFQWNAELDLAVFGQVKSLDDQEKEIRASSEEDDDPDAQVAMYRDSRARGFAFSESFSAWEPRGELGDVHVLEIVEITRHAFDAARRAEWEMDNLVKIDPASYMEIASRWNDLVGRKMAAQS